jgi:hypothetical protein
MPDRNPAHVATALDMMAPACSRFFSVSRPNRRQQRQLGKGTRIAFWIPFSPATHSDPLTQPRNDRIRLRRSPLTSRPPTPAAANLRLRTTFVCAGPQPTATVQTSLCCDVGWNSRHRGGAKRSHHSHRCVAPLSSGAGAASGPSFQLRSVSGRGRLARAGAATGRQAVDCSSVLFVANCAFPHRATAVRIGRTVSPRWVRK